ncbi:hypothetical protein FPG87_02010 [Flavobacterium psychrophilum]|nr:hypothetical protein FPG87_02010 [Flavobacterium psychrophilum]SNA78888.1 hypothetical protein FI070_320023 [Flavobacterium psychrophilum]
MSSKKIQYYQKFWNKLDLEMKRDLLRKYYPNPQNRWSITKEMMIEIYKQEIYNYLKPTADDKTNIRTK